jgi:hypothetical protein
MRWRCRRSTSPPLFCQNEEETRRGRKDDAVRRGNEETKKRGGGRIQHLCASADDFVCSDAVCIPADPRESGSRADRKAVRNVNRPLSEATNVRLSHPSPACGRGVGGEGQQAHPNASNVEFAYMFCPSLNSAGRGPASAVLPITRRV